MSVQCQNERTGFITSHTLNQGASASPDATYSNSAPGLQRADERFEAVSRVTNTCLYHKNSA